MGLEGFETVDEMLNKEKKKKEEKKRETGKSKKREEEKKTKPRTDELIDIPFHEYTKDDFEMMVEAYNVKVVYESDEEVPEEIKGESKIYTKKMGNKELRVAEFESGEACCGYVDKDAIMAKCTCECFNVEPSLGCAHLAELWVTSLSVDWASQRPAPTRETRLFHKNEGVDIKRKLMGKLVILYGSPMVGKTTFAHMLAKQFDACIYLKVDRNFESSDFDAENIFYHEIQDPEHLLRIISELKPAPGTLVVLDSVTSLDAFFISDPTKPSPRMDVARARFADSVIFHLNRIKRGCCVMVIAHEAIKDFNTGEIGPRMNLIALRHADMVFRMQEEKGKRRVILERVRKPVEKPEFEVVGL